MSQPKPSSNHNIQIKSSTSNQLHNPPSNPLQSPQSPKPKHKSKIPKITTKTNLHLTVSRVKLGVEKKREKRVSPFELDTTKSRPKRRAVGDFNEAVVLTPRFYVEVREHFI